MPPSIEAVGLTKKYGDFAALTDLNLTIQGTKCVGFLGPNGAGKTTTMKIFSGLIRPSQGTASINGVSVSGNKKKALAPCATLIETPEIYPSLTAKEALMMLCMIRGVPKEERNKRIEDSLSSVKMLDWQDKNVGSFSKGMKQRINVASTLISDPEVIILDEPTTGLDPRGMSEVREIVKSLGDRLVFMSSHLLAEVTEVCQEVALVDHGKLLVYDTIENVSAKFSGGGGVVSVGFRSSVDESVRVRISAIAGVESVTPSADARLVVRFRTADISQEDLFERIAALRVGAKSLAETSAGLEDAYLNLVKETL